LGGLFGSIWNRIRLHVHGRLARRRNGVFDTASVTEMAILSARAFPNPDAAPIQFNLTDAATIQSLLAEVDFSTYIDGRMLGIQYDAYVYIKRPYGVSKLLICGEYEYILPDNAWTEMREISPAGQDLFRRYTVT
jgi:hypothetical protein